MDTRTEIKIIEGLPEHLYHQTAEIIYEAFGRKINCIIRPKDKAILILERSINPELGFFAISKGKVIGFLGIHYLNNEFLKMNFSNINKEFNFLKSFFIWFLFRIDSPNLKKEEIRINYLAVEKSIRGSGIGTKLTKKFLDYAKKQGFKTARLEVVNTNPRAKKLYEKIGFSVKKIKKYYFLTRRAGFSEEAIMEIKLQN
jgi:ribosomal protein S18 acetylase RimI-like enzyme